MVSPLIQELFFLFVLVLGGETPRGMILVGIGAAFRAWLHYYLGRTLQSARFFEAPVPSLFHVVLPYETCGRRESTAASSLEHGQVGARIRVPVPIPQ